LWNQVPLLEEFVSSLCFDGGLIL